MNAPLRSLPLPDDLEPALAQLAALSGQSTAAIAETALRDYLAWRIPQMLDLQEAIAAANRGEFASDEEVGAFFARYDA